jgi:hypothetical protein
MGAIEHQLSRRDTNSQFPVQERRVSAVQSKLMLSNSWQP